MAFHMSAIQSLCRYLGQDQLSPLNNCCNESLLGHQSETEPLHRKKYMRFQWFLHFSSFSCNISNTRDSVSSGYPDTEKRVENTTRSRVFLTKFDVFG